MENKYLVTIEFRYNITSIDEFGDEYSSYISKTLTIGIYDYFDEACLRGNNILEIMESKFKLHEFPNGEKANKERFSKKNKLITNLAYLKTPFQFFIKIIELKYNRIEKVIDEILKEL